jgi:methylated-DNA-[protein]-cysteine S-methyltransferase
MHDHITFPVETPVGRIGLAYRIRPFRLLRIYLSPDSRQSGEKKDSRLLPDEAADFRRLIHDYFGGRATAIPWHLLDLDPLTPLQRMVLHETAKIDPGDRKPYEDIAKAIGRPRAARFVGSALAKNPFPLIVPCHRVVRKDGKIGNFGGGRAMKKWLLEFEANF